MAASADLLIKVRADLNQASQGLSGLERQLKGTDANLKRVGRGLNFDALGSGLERVGRGFESVGRAGTLAMAPLVVGFGLATKAAIDWESAFAGVRKTVNTSEEGFDALNSGIRAMSQTIPTSANELARIGELGGQLGILPENLLGFIRTIGDLGVSTNLSTEAAAVGLARLMNVMGSDQALISNYGASLVELGNNFATMESEILEGATRIAGAGKIVGLSAGEVLGLATALSSVGVNPEAGGTAMTKTLIEIFKAGKEGGEQLEMFAAVAGVTNEEFARLARSDPAQALTGFLAGVNRISQAGGDPFKILSGLGLADVRQIRALLSLANAGDLLGTAMSTGNDAFEKNTALTEEAQKRYATAASQLAIFKNQLLDVAVTIGGALVPAMLTILTAALPLIGVVALLAQRFASLPPETITTALAIGGLLAVLFPAALVFGTLLTAVGGAVKAFAVLGIAATAIKAVVLGVGAAVSLLGLPLVIVGLAVGALAIAWTQDWLGIQSTTTSVVADIIATLDPLAAKVRSIIGDLRGLAVEAGAGRLGAALGRAIGEQVPDPDAMMKGAFDAADKDLKTLGIVSPIVAEKPKSIFDQLLAPFQKAFDDGQNMAGITDAKKQIEDAQAQLTALASDPQKAMRDAFSATGLDIDDFGDITGTTDLRMEHLKDQLDATKGSLDGIRDALTAARAELQRFQNAPLASARFFDDAIFGLDQEKAAIELRRMDKVADRILGRPARTDAQRLRQIAFERQRLGLQRQVTVDPQERELSRLLEGPALSFEEKRAGILASAGQVSALEAQEKELAAQVTALQTQIDALKTTQESGNSLRDYINSLGIGTGGIPNVPAGSRALSSEELGDTTFPFMAGAPVSQTNEITVNVATDASPDEIAAAVLDALATAGSRSGNATNPQLPGAS